MFEQANVGIVQVTVDGRLLSPNKGFCNMLGYSEREIARLNLRDITHPDDYEKETELTRKLLAGEIPAYSIEKRYVCKDGRQVWGNMTASVVFRTEHDPQYVVAIVEDITERKTAEESLRKSEEHLNLILESTKDYAIITYDLEGRVTRWNAGAENIFGFSEKEAVGQKSHFIFTPEDIAKKEPEKEMDGALKKGRAEDERWHIRKDGSRFFASGVMQPLRDGTTQGFVKICRDQTEKSG
jgi:PAS domain S-box-containing protein